MKLQGQVCNLELSKKLKDLGCKQESLFYWIKPTDNGKHSPYILLYKDEVCWDISCGHEPISAYTVAELGEILPDNLISSGKDNGKWHCIYGPKEDGNDMPDSEWENEDVYEFGYMTISDISEVIVRAKMLIYLIKEDL